MENDPSGFSSPQAVTLAGVHQILFFSGSGLVALSPEDGRVYWRHPWKTEYDVNAVLPVVLPGDRVFLSSGYDVGNALLQIARSEQGFTEREIWKGESPDSDTLRSHLYNLRKTIDRPFDNPLLHTMQTAGYKVADLSGSQGSRESAPAVSQNRYAAQQPAVVGAH